jgi:hypothetical protein
MTTPEESMEERFDKMWTHVDSEFFPKKPISGKYDKDDVLQFIRSYGDERERKAWEEAKGMVEQVLEKYWNDPFHSYNCGKHLKLKGALIDRIEAITTKLTELS